MVLMLIACNVLVGLATGLAFRARAIVVVAPAMALLTFAALMMRGFGFWSAFLWMSLCLFMGQAVFLVVSFVISKPQRVARHARTNAIKEKSES